MNKCIDCNKNITGKTRCWNCHVINLRIQAELREIICKKCHKKSKHCAKGLCEICYRREYRERPGIHEKYREIERKARADGKRKEIEKKRNQTEKRKKWKREYNIKYFAENREKLLAYQREYRKQTARQTTYKQRRRARVAKLPSTLSHIEWEEILKEYNYSCAYCQKSNVDLVREHKIPASRDGGFTKENIVPSCHICNRRKQCKTIDEYREYLLEVGETPSF